MKALSFTRPWGILAALGEKEWETRSQRYYYFGHVAIHSAKGFPKDLRALFPGGLKTVCRSPFFNEALARHGFTSPEMLPVSAIIGMVEIVRYVSTARIRDQLTEKERAFGVYSNGRWAYQLANARLITPVPCNGALGLWDVPKEVAKAIRAQNPQLTTSAPYSLPLIG